jgi:ribosomal protein S18 acetylase RimI-like enzyme
MTDLKEAIPLLASQKAQAAQVLGQAFLVDPAYTALFPDEEERGQALPRLFGAVVGYSLVYGLVDTSPQVEGAACWLSPGNTELTLWRNLRTGLELYRAVGRFNPKARREFLAVLDHLDEVHKRLAPGPHWYLWALGVEPGSQGQGIGSRLVQPVLLRADEDGVPCCLETQTEANVGFYEKRGFEVVSDSVGPGQGIRIWTMLREAHR